jgi:hypothetical protein
MVASSTSNVAAAVAVSSTALERCGTPLVSETDSEEKSSSWYLANACG